MLPLSARTVALVALVCLGCGDATEVSDGGVTDSGAQHRFAIHAEICGEMCDTRASGGRAPGDFTGLGCATDARIRLYAPGAGLVGAPPLVERCIHFGTGSSLADLFMVSAGLQGGISATQGTPIGFPGPATLGRVIAEVALYAPGGEACPADAPFLALGRSSVVDLAAASTTTLAVPLGCHASCATSQDRSLALRLESLDTGVDQLGAFDEITVGELFSYGSLIETAGVCMKPPELETTPVSFRPYVTTRNQPGYKARYGVDPSDFGGCIAVAARRGGVSSYACLEDATNASPRGVVVPESQRAAVAALRVTADTPPTRGTLIIQTVDGAGDPVDGTGVYGPDAAPIMVGPGWNFTMGGPFTQFRGMAIFPDALPGQYSARVIGVGTEAYTFLGGAEAGSITTVRLRVQ